MSYVKMLQNGDIPPKKSKKKPLTAHDRLALEKRAANVSDNAADHAMKAPENISDAAKLADEFKTGKAIYISLERTDAADAERILDFLSGAAYVLSGSVQCIGDARYILVPRGMEILFAGE